MDRRRSFRCALKAAACATALLLAGGARAQDIEYDSIIRGGTIVDGSGLAPYRGDVAIKDGHIVAVGNLAGAPATNMIDATGLMVAPGFINLHSHAQPDTVGTAVNMLTQGVTTEITNADGSGTTNITTQLAGFNEKGLAENIGLYIGFNATWSEIIGPDDRRATPAEIATMRNIVDSNLARGAWGVAAGLDYKPAYFAEADEVVKVVSVARKWRTNFPNHDRVRSEENYSSYKGMAETISIAEQAGLVPVITHMKTQGAEQGNAPAVLAMLDAATARGTYTAADVYPYLAGQTDLTLIMPGWALAGTRQEMMQRFKDPVQRAKIVEETERSMTLRVGGPQGVYLIESGRELTDVIKEMGVRPGEAVVRLLEKGERNGAILRFGLEADLIAFLKYPNSAMACDCGAITAERLHPRFRGSFPRTLGHYVRELGAMSWEDAIRKSSALPATIIGMNDRGYLAPGMSADVVIFDPKTVQDHATYEEPAKLSEGIRYVFVNGRLALRDGNATGEQGGKIMLRTRHMPSRPMTPADQPRSVSASGSVVNGASSLDVNFAVAQRPNQRFTSGYVRLVDRASGTVWTEDRLGTIQTAKGWASLTAVLRDQAGNLQPATITIDYGEGIATLARPSLVVSLDGGPELTGSPKGPVRITAR